MTPTKTPTNFFSRIGRVEIFDSRIELPVNGGQYEQENLRVFEDLDFKFKITKVSDMCTTKCYGALSILGLNREDIIAYATTKPVGIEAGLRRRVRVYASYEDFGDNLIFDGDIVKAQPSIPPENWLNISAFVGNYRHYQLYSSSINEELSVEQLMLNSASVLGIPTVKFIDGKNEFVQAERKRKLKGFDCSGTKEDLLQMLNRVSDFVVFEDNGMLKCMLRYGGIRRSRTTAALISESSGMIGIPEVLVGSADGRAKKSAKDDSPSSLRLKVKCFINPSIQLWDLVYLQSVYLPGADGYYTVNEIDYDGHLRGQNWYMTMTLTATNVGRT